VTRRPGSELPRWRVLHQAMSELGNNELLSYERMGELLSLDPADRRKMFLIGKAAKRAANELRDHDRRIATLVRGQGYQIADTEQVLALAQRHQSRAISEVEAGAAAVDTIDQSTLDPVMARLVQATAMGFARQQAIMNNMDVRQRRLETTMEALASTTESTAHRVKETSTRMERAEAELAQLRQTVEELQSSTTPPARTAGNLPSPFLSQ
jgi:DNA repair exonuclease SbcCD ATPase subunit